MPNTTPATDNVPVIEYIYLREALAEQANVVPIGAITAGRKGTDLAELAGMTALGIILTRRVKNLQWLEVSKSFNRSLLAALLMATAAWFTAHLALPMLGNCLPAKIAQIATVGLAITIGALVYFGITLLLRSPELREIKSALTRRK